MAPPEGDYSQGKDAMAYVHTGDKLGLGADNKNPCFIENPDNIPKPGLFGIRWGKTPGEIDNLNRLVDAKCQYFLEESRRTGVPLSPEVEYVLKTGKPSTVYKERYTFWPVVAGIGHLANVAYQFYMDPFASICVILFSWLYYDLFSGVLHVVHDNPIMIQIPVVSEPTLEFQWHHHIPQDLTSKSFLEVCGDLNTVTTLIFIVYCNPIGPYDFTKNATAMTIISWKFLFAYFGQLCHAMSHMPYYRRPEWINSLQKMGLMVSPKEHWGHHKNYDDNYCIGSGIWNPVLTPFLKLTNKIHIALGSTENASSYCWLVGFLCMAVLDVPLITHVFTDVLRISRR